MPTTDHIDRIRRIASADGLAVVSTSRLDSSIQSSVVTAGMLDHPVTEVPSVAFVAIGGTVKLRNLRRVPRATVVFRSGGSWVAIEGPVSLAGPDDPLPGLDAGRVPQLLRDIFVAAGGSHDNWEEYDRVMAEERRCAVLVQAERVYP